MPVELNRRIVDRRTRTLKVFDRVGALKGDVISASDGLPRFESLLSEGHPGVILYTHPRASDPFRIQKAYIDNSRVIAARELVFVVAHHQHSWLMGHVGDLYAVRTPTVVTPRTYEKRKNILHPTQKLDLWTRLLAERAKTRIIPGEGKKLTKLQLQWNQRNKLSRAWGAREYLQEVGEAFRRDRVVGASPQAGRSERLGEPSKVVEMLFNKVEGVDMDKVVFSFAGVDPGTPREKSKSSKLSKLKKLKDNLFGKWKIRIGSTMTGAEIREEAAAQNITIDQLVFAKLAKISPSWYGGEVIGS